ncbi:signal transduction histidine kinase [Actinoplanes lutulentus]|uniref:histidine kinase n=1 Tax=Actinoplanes lutulentus TaxID=1287878 RepID=A0A327ZQJ8_9ACTN|nr:nitrate- and nitrite sensing domain-containing protein [Actinoplanes lutulentus]MBB2940889.1 signal transduction histidine kinase [Actinoplanes lutulentus]RAK43198.1 signal transduction histidine kinase [Actinoplanes lutulentus]
MALLIWFAASGYLIFQGFYNRAVAISVRDVSIPAVSALSSIQQERRLSVAYLARPSTNLNSLLEQRRTTDGQLTELREVAPGALSQAPDSIKNQWQTLVGYLDQLPAMRSSIDARSTTPGRAYDVYNELLDAATTLFDIQARITPDATAALGGVTSVEMFKASDLMSRAASTMDGAFAAKALGRSDHLEFVRLVGAYRFELDNIRDHLEPTVRERLQTMEASSAWNDLNGAENSIIASAPWKKGVPGGVTVNRDRWAMITGTVSQSLVDLTIDEADQVSARTLRTGNNQLLTALLGSLVALAISIGVILWALRSSAVLVDRALSTRLSRLGTDAGALVDTHLPAVMARLRKRESVDLETEFAATDYGSDEIGQVADVIHRSLTVAAEAAVDEAKARAAGTAMLMGVARRPQRPLQRGLKVIEDLQGQIGDEKLLTHLFDIHHQLNQTRRFLENLVILAGGQIGRRFSKPVPLRRVLLASFAEARDYQRINLRGATDVALVGYAVAEVIHLMAELLDNALAFSPPGTTVWVTSSRAQHGVAVEIEDAGVGMSQEAIDRANTLLATAPTPEVTELKDGSQVGLYVVAELAKREGLQVSLRRSAYGGLLAIVLLPERLLIHNSEPDEDTGSVSAPVTPAVPPAREEAAPAPAPVAVLERPRQMTPAPDIAVPATAVPEKASAPSETRTKEAARPGTKPPLPQRRPQQHLAPGLREAVEDEPEQVLAPRSPDDVRNRFARYQRGWAEGQAANNETETTAEQGRDE